jgi:hypothetical protein
MITKQGDDWMKCTKCDEQMIKGVIYGRSGTHWMPQEEYEKQGIKQLTRKTSSIVKIGRLEDGNQIIDDMYYCPHCHIVIGEIKEAK